MRTTLMESPVQFSGDRLTKAHTLVSVWNAKGKVLQMLGQGRRAGQSRLHLQSGCSLMCVALHIVTNVFPAYPRVTATGQKGDSRPVLKIPLVCGRCQPPGVVIGTAVDRI